MTKETYEIEKDDREGVRKEQCSDKKDEERKLRVRRAIARKTNGERTTGNKVTVERERDNGIGEDKGTCDMRNEYGNKRRESKCVEKGSQ